MPQHSTDVLCIDDRERQMQIFKALNDEINELQSKERKVDDDLQKLLIQQDELIDEEQQSSTNLSNLKNELTLKKIQIKYLNEKISEARKKQDNFYDQLHQYKETIEEKSLLNKLNADLITKTDEESFLDEEHQLLLEQQKDMEKQIDNYQQKLDIYRIDLTSNEKQLEILQSNITYLEQDLKDCQEKKELNEKNLSESRKKLVENQNGKKTDEEQLRVLNEKFSQLKYLKTFIQGLIEDKQKLAKKEDSSATLTRIQKELDQMPTSFKNQLEEIDNRRQIIANEIKIKQTEINNLKKDLEQITTTTTTIDFTTSSTMSIIEKERDVQLTQNEEDIQLDLNLIQNEKDRIDDIMKTNQTEYKNLQDELQSIENDLIKSKNLQTHQKQLETDRETLKKLSVDHQKLLQNLVETEGKLRQVIEELPTAHLQLCNLLQTEKKLNQEQKNAEHHLKIADQNLKTAKKSFDLGKTAFDKMDEFVKINPTASVVGLDTKQRMVEARNAAVKRAEDDLKLREDLLPKRQEDYETAMTNRIQAGKTLEDLEKQIPIEKENVKKIKSKLNDLEQEIKKLERKVSESLDDYEKAEQNNEELKDQRDSRMNEIKLKEREMKLDQEKLNFLLNKIEQNQKELNDLKRLKGDLNKQRNEMQKQNEQFIQSKKIATTNEIKTIDLNKEEEIRQFESEIFDLESEDNQLNGKKEALQTLSGIISKNIDELQKNFQDEKGQYAKIKNQIQGLEDKLQSSNIVSEFAEKSIKHEEDKQKEFEEFLRNQTTEIVLRHVELQSSQLTKYQLEIQTQVAQSQQNKLQNDLISLKKKLDKNEEETRDVQTTIRDLQRNIDEEHRSSIDIDYTKLSEKVQIGFAKKEIRTIKENIEQLNTEFMEIEPELNRISTEFKVVYQSLFDCARKLAEIQPEILKKLFQINDYHHEIAEKEDINRNYIEQQSKFTFDEYIYLYPVPQSKIVEQK